MSAGTTVESIGAARSGGRSSRTSNVMAIAKTPSLNASKRSLEIATLLPCSCSPIESLLARERDGDLQIKHDQHCEQHPIDDVPGPAIDARHLRHEQEAVCEIRGHQ